MTRIVSYRVLFVWLVVVSCMFGGSTATVQAQPANVTGPALTVDAAASNHPISPYIYGMNFADPALLAELQLPVNRWGGNATTRYNYQTNIANHASDWYYENILEGNGALPDDSEANRFIDRNNTASAETLLTIPTIGYVSNADSGACSFPISVYGAQQDNDWEWRPDCGNGIATDSTPIAGNDPLIAHYAIDETFVAGWVTYLNGRYGTAATANGVRFYALDNEPDLWHETHRDVHPGGAGYDEMRDAATLYGAAIKAADPDALVLGPVSFGWWGYFHSAKDVQEFPDTWWNGDPATHPDRFAHGDQPFLEWYLQQLAAYETANGVRVLDYLDVHFYSQDGTSLAPAGDATLQALRLRSTRSLWDPTFTEVNPDGSPTWIGEPVYLIPRMQALIAANYPGTRLAITEYNWGGLEHINGALAQADVLGVFGREGVDLATIWSPPAPTDPGAYAFRMYLNYDGARSRFGDVSVQASSANYDQLSIYGSKDSTSGALKLMIVNKTATELTSDVAISGFASGCAATVYRYSPSNPTAIVTSSLGVSSAGFTGTFPAQSITLVVIPLGSGSCSADPIRLIQPIVSPGPLLVNPSFEFLTSSTGLPSAPAQLVIVQAMDLGVTQSGEQIGGLAVPPSLQRGMPYGWSEQDLNPLGTGNGWSCNGIAHDGQCALRIRGNGQAQTVSQTVSVGGRAGDTYTLSFWSRGSTLIGAVRARVTIFYPDGTSRTSVRALPTGTYDWQEHILKITPRRPYIRIDVVFEFQGAGTWWLDHTLLARG